MNRQIKDKWITALRSGEYKQDPDGGRLKTCNGYCCLGVLADLYIKETDKDLWETVDEENYYELDGNCDFLPETVKNWAEMENGNPFLMYDDGEGESYEQNLTELNDSGVSFNTLADLIEEQVK